MKQVFIKILASLGEKKRVIKLCERAEVNLLRADYQGGGAHLAAVVEQHLTEN